MKTKVDAPFRSQSLDEAHRIAATYTFVIEADPTLKYVGWTRELPGVMADGDSVESCARAAVFAVESAVAALLEDGQTPPAPTSRQRRTEQVNLRLTKSEKALLSQESVRRGYRGLGDFIRALVLEQTQSRRAG